MKKKLQKYFLCILLIALFITEPYYQICACGNGITIKSAENKLSSFQDTKLSAARKIITDINNPILHRNSVEVNELDYEYNAKCIVEDLIATLKEAGDSAMALSAPQIGINKRIYVVKEDDKYVEVINPVLLRSVDEQDGLEDCLSAPGVIVHKKRPKKIIYKAYDRLGKSEIRQAVGIMAQYHCHCMEHLEGIMITDEEESWNKQTGSMLSLKRSNKKESTKKKTNKTKNSKNKKSLSNSAKD